MGLSLARNLAASGLSSTGATMGWLAPLREDGDATTSTNDGYVTQQQAQDAGDRAAANASTPTGWDAIETSVAVTEYSQLGAEVFRRGGPYSTVQALQTAHRAAEAALYNSPVPAGYAFWVPGRSDEYDNPLRFVISAFPGRYRYRYTLTVTPYRTPTITQYNLRYRVQGTVAWTTRNVGAVLTYALTNLQAGTTYEVQVQARTASEASEWTASTVFTTQASAATRPSRLAAPTVAALSTSSLRATWTAPSSDGGSAIRGYGIRWQRRGTATWESRNLGNVLTYDITGLEAGQTYDVQVDVFNAIGSAGWSPLGSGTTNSPPPPSNAPVPTIDSVVVGYSNFRSSYFWQVAYSDNPRVPHDIRMRWRLQGATDWEVKDWTSIGALAARTVSTTPASITTTGTYEVQIQTSLDGDTGPLSAWTAIRNVVVGAASAPSTPAIPTVTALSSSSLRATWVRPSNGGATISRFNLRYRKQGSAAWISTLNVGNVLTYDITGLDPSATYEVQIQAVNSVGSSNFSASGTGTTNAAPTTPPSRTVIASVSTDGNNALIVRWTPPAAGTSAITNYDVRHRREGTSLWTTTRVASDARSYRVTGLTGGATYEFQVRAISAHGNGVYSTTVTGTAVSATVPGVPAITAVDPRETAMLVTITAPVSDGGSAVLWYDIQYGTIGGGLTRFSRWLYAAGQGAITGLSRGTTYRLQVRAVNAQGEGPWTAEYNASTTSALPSVPTAIGLSPGNEQIAVSFSAPASNGGSAITQYDIRHKLASASNWTTTTDVSSPHVLENLTNGETYDVQVRAVNAAGNGPWSATAQATPDAGITNVVVHNTIALEQPTATRLVPPGDPDITMITPDNHTLLVNWAAPTEGGTHPIEYYDVRHRSGIEWTTVDRAARDTEYLIRGLANEIPVDVQVRAVSEAGLGPWSASVRAIPDVQYHQPSGILKALSFNGNVWGISADGILYNTHDLSDAWHDFARIPKHETPVTDMVEYRGPNGYPTIYAITETSLWWLDIEQESFRKTAVKWPRRPNAGKGSVVWLEELYIPAGLSVHRFTVGNPSISTIVGPDRAPGGISWDGDSQIVKLAEGHNELIAVVQNLESENPSGTSHLLGYNGRAWYSIWTPTNHVVMTDVLATTIFADYSAWIGYEGGMSVIDLPFDLINPTVLTERRRYAAEGFAITPWFTASKVGLDKLSTELYARCTSMSLTETLTIEYELDYSGRWILLDVINADGTYMYQLPNGERPAGVAFDAIRFRFTERRGNDVTLSPDLRGFSLSFIRLLETKWGFQATVNLAESHAGRTPSELRRELLKAASKLDQDSDDQELMPFRFRNDEDEDELRYVAVERMSLSSRSGLDPRGTALVYLSEK